MQPQPGEARLAPGARALSLDAAAPATTPAPSRVGGFAFSGSDLAALVAVLFWGFNFPVVKSVMVVLDPLAMTLVRVGLMALTYTVIMAITRQWTLPARRDLPRLLTIGFIGLTINQIALGWGLHLTTASHSGLIFTLTPLFVFGLSYALGHMQLRGTDLAGLALGVVGAALIVGAPSLLSGGDSGALLEGDLLTVVSAITWGLWTLWSAPLIRRYGALRTTTWIAIVGWIGLLPFALPAVLAQDWSVVAPPEMLVRVLYAGTLGGALGGLLWYRAVGKIGAARTAIYANMESFFTVLFAALLLGERVEWTALVGGVAVVGGVLLTRRSS